MLSHLGILKLVQYSKDNLIMKRTILYILFLTFFVSAAHGQTLKAFMQAAEEAMEDKDYYNAAYYYKTAIEFDSSDLNVRYNLANASLKFNAFTIAEDSYQFVVDNDSGQEFPMATFHLAETQQRLGKYELAKRNFNLYLSENRVENERSTLKAEKEIEAINWAIDKKDNPVAGVDIEQMDNGMNTPYSEYSAIRIDSQLYYSSHRFEKDEDRDVNRLFSKVLKSEDGKSNVLLDESFNESGPHIGNVAFNNERTSVYYTVCNYVNSFDITCDIYTRKIDENGNWGEGIRLPSSINDSTSTNTQPSVGYDLNIDKEILYFVSDRKDGNGGLDIWYSVIQDDSYADPVNLQELNTRADELTPFFHVPTSMLYFSTNGRFGMGGLDVYSSQKHEGGYGEPVNLGVPQNTSFDDIYYSLNPDGTEAFLSSNRTGSLYLDDSYEACCFDIYRAEIEELFVDLNLLTFNEINNDPVPGARVRIIDPITEEVLFDSMDPLSHKHTFQLKCNREFNIITEKDGYETDETSLRSSDCNDLKEIIRKIYLTPKRIRLEVFTFDKDTDDPLNGTTVILKDLADLNAEPIVVLDPNGNFYDFEILAGGRYELIAEKRGYETVTQLVNSNAIIDGVITEKLYLYKRIVKLNEFLPVTVYFDNDRPNRRSKKMYTDLSYTNTYGEYYAKKEEFKRSYTKTLNGSSIESGNLELESFFENDVKVGYDKLKLFVSKLKERLDGGDQIELSLKGFASPRAANRYNLALGQRRIWTLKNEISTYEGGILSPYIKSGQLSITEVSFGEEIAPDGISDSFANPRLSVFSVEASKERKAEIVRVRILN